MSDGERALETASSVVALGKYLVLAELGRGGMAEVYLALSRGPSGFHKLVVLKLLRTHLAEDASFLGMFLAEARLAARLNHANIVQTYEIGVEGGRNAIVMEYLEGRSLSEVDDVAKDDPMPLNLGLRVLSSTLAALHYAHELPDVDGKPLGLVHRDVSPQNVLLTYDGQVKLLDFGIAKAANDVAYTKTGVFKGKLRYTSPGRFVGEENDRRSDIFSVGVMLWQLLTRRRLWHGMNEIAVMKELAKRAPIPSPRSIDPTIDARLDAICSKALAIDPDARFQTALAMEEALEEFLAGESNGVTSRAIAKFMSDRFGDTRAMFKKTLDEQMRIAANVPLEPQRYVSGSRLRAQGVPDLGSGVGADSISSMAVAPPSSSASFSRVKTLDGASSVGVLEGSVSIVVQSAPPPALSDPPRRRRSRAPIVAVLLLVAVVGLVVALVSRRAPATPATSVTAAAPEHAGPTAATTGTQTPGVVATSAASPSATPAGAVFAPASGGGVPTPAPRVTAAAPTPARPRPAAVSPGPPRSAPSVPAADTSKRDACSSPYFIDDQGVKKIRPECL